MKPFVKILLIFALVITGMEMLSAAVAPVQEEMTAVTGVICETDGTLMIEHRQWEDLGLIVHGGEYVPAGTLSQTAGTRIPGGARRSLSSFKNVFVKDRTLVNIVNPIGFVIESSSYVSGTLSAGAHFVILRKFRI